MTSQGLVWGPGALWPRWQGYEVQKEERISTQGQMAAAGGHTETLCNGKPSSRQWKGASEQVGH